MVARVYYVQRSPVTRIMCDTRDKSQRKNVIGEQSWWWAVIKPSLVSNYLT